jgi:hypothetical protein
MHKLLFFAFSFLALAHATYDIEFLRHLLGHIALFGIIYETGQTSARTPARMFCIGHS